MGGHRVSELDLYNPTIEASSYKTSMFDWYRLPLDKDHTVLVVSTTSSNATLWVIAYTVLVTMIFVAACELATLMVLTYFQIGNSRNRHVILIAYYNAGSASRVLPKMLGYIYNGLFRCRKGSRWAVDWTAVTGSCVLFSIAFSLLSCDLLTKFFLGGKALIRGNVAQVNPHVVFYPYLDASEFHSDEAYAQFNAFKGRRAPAAYQAITRKTSMGSFDLRNRIKFKELLIEANTTQREFHYQYKISGYELGLRDAPGLMFGVKGHCKTTDSAVTSNNATLDHHRPTNEMVDIYPFFNLTSELDRGTLVPIERESYTAPWVYFKMDTQNITYPEIQRYGGWAFQFIPHTALRLSRTPNPRDPNLPPDPWYATELNPNWDNDPAGSYNAQYRVKARRSAVECFQNDTFTYNGRSVNSPERLQELEPYGLKLSPFVRFVLEQEFIIPVFAPILGYVPFASLASGVHFVPNGRRLDAERANMSRDIRELIEISYVYSREVVRNTFLLFREIETQQQRDIFVQNAARRDDINLNDADFLIDSPDVAALSVKTLIVTPAVCALLWAIVLGWTWIFNTRSKLDNKGISGRYGLRRAGLQATQLYRFLDEQMSSEEKWSGRQTTTPYIRDLDQSPPRKQPFTYMNQGSGSGGLSETHLMSHRLEEPRRQQRLPSAADVVSIDMTPHASSITLYGNYVNCDFPKPKIVQLPNPGASARDTPLKGNQLWLWVKRSILRARESTPHYDITMTRVWDRELPPVKRKHVQENV